MHAFTPDEYRRVWDAGVLGPTDDVELLRGLIVLRHPRSLAHDLALQQLHRSLVSITAQHIGAPRLGCRVKLFDSVLSPDLAVGSNGPELNDWVTPRDVLLVVEVADASLEVDTLDKIPIYARDGIAFYWIVNLVDRQIEVHEQPSGATANPGYSVRRVFRAGDAVPLVLDGFAVGTIPVAELLP